MSETKITLKSSGSLKQYTAYNEAGHTIMLSGDGSAVGPMQSVLMAVAGCSTIDVVMILEKMKQDVKDVKVEVTGIRREEIPRIYTSIQLHFIISGAVKDKKAEQAVNLSLEKYCSVSHMLQPGVEITGSFEVRDS